MIKIVKFPKQLSIFTGNIKKAIEQKDYLKIADSKNEILSQLTFFQGIHPNIEFVILESLLAVKKYDDVIATGESLLHQPPKLEDFQIYFYILAALIAQGNIEESMEMIAENQLLNDPSIQYYCARGENNLERIQKLSPILLNFCGLCLLLVNYIYFVIDDKDYLSTNKKELLLLKYFDFLMAVNKIGFSEEIIDSLTLVMSIVFDLG